MKKNCFTSAKSPVISCCKTDMSLNLVPLYITNKGVQLILSVTCVSA